jgi:hypothetical protein
MTMVKGLAAEGFVGKLGDLVGELRQGIKPCANLFRIPERSACTIRKKIYPLDHAACIDRWIHAFCVSIGDKLGLNLRSEFNLNHAINYRPPLQNPAAHDCSSEQALSCFAGILLLNRRERAAKQAWTSHDAAVSLTGQIEKW